MKFDDVVERILEHEGGYVNDPDDPGGETNFGISKRAFPDEDIAGMTRDRAKELYREHYWDAIRCDDLPEAVRGSVFDMAVNAGPGIAVTLLQRCVNAFTQSQVAVDGKVGPITIAAAAAAPADGLLAAFTARRAAFYLGLAEQRPASRKFLRGWLRRGFSWMGEGT